MANGKSKITAKRKTASNAKKVTARRATIKKTLKTAKVVSKEISAKATTAKKKALTATVSKQKVSPKKAAPKKTISKQKVTIASLEKIIAQTQAQLASLFEKEISQLGKQRDKIKLQLRKAQDQQRVAQDKFLAIQAKAGQKLTPAIKLRLSKAKQVVSKTERLALSIEKQLTDVEKQLKPFADGHAKHAALAIEIKAFEKQWGKAPITKMVSKTATASKPKSEVNKAIVGSSVTTTHKTPVKPKSSKPVDVIVAESPTVATKTKINPPITVEPILDDMLTDDMLETTSEIETDTI